MKRFWILLCLLIPLCLCACTSRPKQPDTPTVQQLASPLTLSEDESALVLCCTENSALLAVGHRNGAQTGPLYNTDYLLLWDYAKGTTKKISVDSPAYIISAVPDGSDILYVDYEYVDDADDDSLLAWSLIRVGDAGRTVLSSGRASYFDRVPALFSVAGRPMCLCADDHGVSVYRIEDSGLVSSLSITDAMFSVTVHSNGTQYAFLTDPYDADYCKAYICDGSGILYQYELSQQVTTFAINDSYLVCGLGDPNTDRFSYEAIRLSDGTSSTAASTTPMWRLAGSGNSCLYVDDDFASYVLYPELQQVEKLAINQTATYKNWPTLFYSAGASGYLVEMDIDDTITFWHITT